MKRHIAAEYFERLGDDFELFMDDYDVAQRIELVFSHLLRGWDLAGKTVLEVGCGTGRFSRLIVEKGARLTVLDVGTSLVRKVRAVCGAPGVVGDACSLPVRTASFDAVISSECIEHTADPIKAVEEMCRVCAPGGIVCLTTPNRLWRPVLTGAQRLGLRKFAGPETWISPQQARAVMQHAKMVHVALRGCHLWPFQVRPSRPLLRLIDRYFAQLYPVMINFGIVARKPVTLETTALDGPARPGVA